MLLMTRVLLPLIIVVGLFLAAGYYFLNHQGVVAPIPTPLAQGKVCEPDSMVCEDGTVLKREGPKCDFPPCPGYDSTSSGVMPNYSPVPNASSEGVSITISGVTICLPHKNTSGPQTLECALGLEGDDGNNYGLNDPGWKFLIGTGNGVKVEITGTLTRKGDSKYDSAGIIEIENLTKK